MHDRGIRRDLTDFTAVDRERSHVSGDAYRKISQIVDAAIEATREETSESAASTATIAKRVAKTSRLAAWFDSCRAHHGGSRARETGVVRSRSESS